MDRPQPKRSNEPVFWLLFAAGGMVAALLLPAMILVAGIAAPLGLLPPDSLAYERVAPLLGTWAGKAIAFVCVSLLFWHAMHRIYHGLHDLGIRAHPRVYRSICYGFALLGTAATAWCLFLI